MKNQVKSRLRKFKLTSPTTRHRCVMVTQWRRQSFIRDLIDNGELGCVRIGTALPVTMD